MKPSVRFGFTIVELLVVIAIIGVIVGLIFPAVQQAREAGRRATCVSNLHQLAFAAINYQETYKVFPPGCLHLPTNTFDNGKEGVEDSGASVDIPCGMIGWPAFLLPFLEAGDTLYRDIDFSQPAYADYCGHEHLDGPCPTLSTTTNIAASRNCPSIFRCPSTLHVSQSMKGMKDYAANGAVDWPERVNHDLKTNTDNDRARNRAAVMGVFYRNSGVSLTNIKDGSSHTFLFVEQSAMLLPKTYCPKPAEFGANPFFFVNSGSQGFAVCYIPGEGNAISPNDLSLDVATRGPRSFHPIGLNSVMGDGSTKFIRETIGNSVWQATFTRSQGQYDYRTTFTTPSEMLEFGGGLRTAESLR